ncbi:hypothetical protein P7794_13950 [Staphylococcus aureus]|nr:hypothetical protein [Staphylococcus aureus]
MNNIGIIITIIGTILTVFNTISAIRWRRRNYNYRKQIDYYKNELEEANQKYIKNLNNKKELTEFINNFVKLSYSTIMSCISFLYTLDFITKSLTKNNEYISQEKLEKLLQRHFNIKKDINILKTDTTQLYLHSSDKNEIALVGGTFNEIYFLNEFIG